jgi:hypothetical protein
LSTLWIFKDYLSLQHCLSFVTLCHHCCLICSTLQQLSQEWITLLWSFKILCCLINFCLELYLSTGSLQGSSFGEVGSSNVALNSLHGRNAEGKKMPEHSLFRCSKSQNRGLRFSSNYYKTPLIEVETVAQNELFDYCSDRFVQHIFIPLSYKISSVWTILNYTDCLSLYIEMSVNKQVIVQDHWNVPPKNHRLQKATAFV